MTVEPTAQPFELLPSLVALGEIARVRFAGLEGNADVYLPHDREELSVLERARKLTSLFPDNEPGISQAHRVAIRSLRLLFADWFQGTKGRYERFLGLLGILDGTEKLPACGYLLGEELLMLKHGSGQSASGGKIVLEWRSQTATLSAGQAALLEKTLATVEGCTMAALGKIADGESAARTAISTFNKLKLLPIGLQVINFNGYYKLGLAPLNENHE